MSRYNIKLFQLKESGIDEQDLRLIKTYIYNKRATVRVGNVTSQDFTIQRGVRQGCILSPTLFNVYWEMLFKEFIDEIRQGMKLNGENIDNLRYPDDTVLMANSVEDL